MKTTSMALTAAALLMLSGCNKKTLTDTPLPPAPSDAAPEVRVSNGSLQFTSFASYDRFLHMGVAEKMEFCRYLENLPGFTSKREILTATGGGILKTNNECDCPIDNEVINSIVDANYMLVIENFRVKLNGCTERVYVSDELTVGADERRAALINCDYTNDGLYQYTFQDVVEEELPILRSILNGTPQERRCRETPISNRSDSRASGPAGLQVAPSFEVTYVNFGISGRVRVRMTRNEQGVTNPTSWEFKFINRHFRLRCEQDIDDGPAITSKTLNGNFFEFIVHDGTRLTNYEAGVDAYSVKLNLRVTKGTVEETEPIEIIP